MPEYNLSLPGSLDNTSPARVGVYNSKIRLLYDVDLDQSSNWTFRLPDDYSSTPELIIQYAMETLTSGTVAFDASVMAVTPGDAAAIDADSYDTVNAGSQTVAGTVGYMKEITISLTNFDSAAAGDWIALKLAFDSAAATATGGDHDCEIYSLTFKYT